MAEATPGRGLPLPVSVCRVFFMTAESDSEIGYIDRPIPTVVTPIMDGDKGSVIFQDVFRRADKNDDGAISWEEFKSFFADGVLTEDQLRDLFQRIDTHNTANIDTGELSTYFSQHLGAFKGVLGAVEELNATFSTAVQNTSESYPTASVVEQFITRFLVREVSNQMTALLHHVEIASEKLDEQALEERNAQQDGEAEAPLYPCTFPVEQTVRQGIVPGRIGRRARHQVKTQTSWQSDGGFSSSLGQQVDRLQQLINRMENKVTFEGVAEEVLDIHDENMLTLVHRQMKVEESSIKSFRNALRAYVETTHTDDKCRHLSVRSYAGTNVFRIYEIWQSDGDWKSHLVSAPSKAFQHSKVDQLEVPEQVNTVQIPESWWKTDP